MTTMSYRRRQQEINAFYQRAAGWLMVAGIACCCLAIGAILRGGCL